MGAEGGVSDFVEVEEVTVTPRTVIVKLRIVGCVGRVSATKVKLILPEPPVQFVVHPPVLLGPLQEEMEKAASRRMGR